MIQIFFTIVLLLLVVYIYRLFFVASSTAAEGSTGLSDTNQLNQKIDQLLQQRSATGAEVVASPSSVGQSAVQSAEIEKMRSELVILRNALNESEKKVYDMSPSAGSESNSLLENNSSEEKVTALAEKVEKLEARLAEYDVIADDIAELSQLRSENSQLKDRLKISGETPAPDKIEPEAPMTPEDLGSELNSEIPENEKNVLDDFEKLMKKGSS